MAKRTGKQRAGRGHPSKSPHTRVNTVNSTVNSIVNSTVNSGPAGVDGWYEYKSRRRAGEWESMTQDTHPTPNQLDTWRKEWQRQKRQAYRDLVNSYTPEQRAIIARMNRAEWQAKLCGQRLRWPQGQTGRNAGLIAWPQAPTKKPEPE
jgi:hypothetical protein